MSPDPTVHIGPMAHTYLTDQPLHEILGFSLMLHEAGLNRMEIAGHAVESAAGNQLRVDNQ